MRSHTVRYMNPKRRHKRRRGGSRRRRNPFGLSGVKGWKSALPIVISGAVAGAALYAGGKVLEKYPQPTPQKAALLIGGVGLVGGIAAAMLAGPIPGAIVAASMATLAISAATAPPAPQMTTSGMMTLKPRILPVGSVLADSLGRVKPIGAVLADNLGSLGAGSMARKHESKQVSDLIKKLGPRA